MMIGIGTPNSRSKIARPIGFSQVQADTMLNAHTVTSNSIQDAGTEPRTE
jgi:hypothetical protein